MPAGLRRRAAVARWIAELATQMQLDNAAIPLCVREASGYTRQCTGHRLETFKTTSATIVAAPAVIAVAG
jgi:hypothetical protein